jgi:hypothetical protein
MSTPRVDIGEVLQSYSRKLLHDFYEEARTSNIPFDDGQLPEAAVRQLLSTRLPGRYGVGEGIVIDGSGGQSRQCDVVIYDWERTPILSSETGLTIWPFESIYAVAQVKSKLTRSDLESAVETIASFKALSRLPNDLGSAPGFDTRAAPRNPAIGLLIAHETELEADEIQAILTSVPRKQQIDDYCVISGRVGVRVERRLQRMIINSRGDHFAEMHAGDGALAAFLLITISVLNQIELGDQNLLSYLPRYLPANPPTGGDQKA